MEETKVKTGKIGWMYGLYGGLAGVALSLMLYFMDMMTTVMENPVIQLIGVLIWIVFMILGIKHFKKANAGYITVSQGLKIGAAVGLICGLIALLSNFLLGVLDPELIETMTEFSKQKTFEAYPQMTEEQWDQNASIGAIIQNIATVILPIIVGLIVGAITGAIIKNKRPE